MSLNFVKPDYKKTQKDKVYAAETRMELSSYNSGIKIRKAVADAMGLAVGDFVGFLPTGDGTPYFFKSSEDAGVTANKIGASLVFNSAPLKKALNKLASLDENDNDPKHLIIGVGEPVENATCIGFDDTTGAPQFSETEVSLYYPLSFKAHGTVKSKSGDVADEVAEEVKEAVEDSVQEELVTSTSVGLDD